MVDGVESDRVPLVSGQVTSDARVMGGPSDDEEEEEACSAVCWSAEASVPPASRVR